MRSGLVVLALLAAECEQDSSSPADDPTPTTSAPSTSSTPAPSAVHSPTASATVAPPMNPVSRPDPRWVFFTKDRNRHASPWFAGEHQVMIPCGTELYAARPARVQSNDALGPAYGENPVLLRMGDRDLVIGHTRRVFVGVGDRLAAGDRFAMVGDSAPSTRSPFWT